MQVTAVSSMGQTDAAPVTPIVVPTGTSTNTITVTWTHVIGARSYNIFLSTHAFPLFQGNYPASPQTIGTAGTGAAAPTVNTAWDEMPDTTKVRILHRSLMGQVLYEILNERNYVLAKPFVGKGKLLHLECYPMTVFSPDVVVVQVRGLAVSGGDVNPVRSRFRLSAHWERERI
ncbi:MAG: hypothetical protein DDT26_02609 [Dehalococcoidia bacterium]|nr:hypothetical protein [Chloroflexota bacterium]